MLPHAALQSLLGKGSAITIFVHALNCNIIILKIQRPSMTCGFWHSRGNIKARLLAFSTPNVLEQICNNTARAHTRQVALCHCAPLLVFHSHWSDTDRQSGSGRKWMFLRAMELWKCRSYGSGDFSLIVTPKIVYPTHKIKYLLTTYYC